MKKHDRVGAPLAGLTVAAMLLAGTVGYVSALSHIFEAQDISVQEENALAILVDDGFDARVEEARAVSAQQALARTAPAWLLNALPAYTSSRAREAWYFALDRAGDRIGFETAGNFNASTSSGYVLFNPAQFNSVAGFVSAGAPKTSGGLVLANTGSTISWSGLGANNSWTTAANWTGGVAPANDLTTDLALFDLTSYPRQPTANSVSIAGIRIGDGVTLTAALTISGSGTGLAIGADGIQIFANAGATTLSALTTIGAAQSWTNGSSNLFTIATGGVTYSNLLTLNGGTFRFNAAGTGAGGVKITSGSTVTNGSTGLIFGTGTLELNSGSYINSTTSSTRSLANVVSITGNFTFDSGGGINEFSGGASTTGDVTLTVNTATTRFVTNPFTLGGNLTTAGTGRLNLQAGLNLGGADRTITAGATGASPGNFISGAIDSSAAGNKLILQGNNFSIGSGATGVTPGANIVNFDVNATGTITFGAANTFLGSVTVEAGTVNVTNDSGLGNSTAATAGLFMTPSAGTATVNFTSLAPAIASLSSSGAGTSSVVLGNTIGTPSATTLTVGGNNASTTFAGVISDKAGTNAAAIGSLTKTGTGTLILTNANTYTGTTTVSGGTLLINNVTGSGTGTGAVLVNSTGTLGGAGFIDAGINTITINGTLSPGSVATAGTAGTITLKGGALTLGSGSTTMFDLGTSQDLIALGGTTTLSVGGTLSLDLGAGFSYSNTYTLFNGISGAASGTFASVTGYDTADYTANLFQSGSEYDISFTPVPEPGTWIGGALALLAVGLTQRKRFSKTLASCWLNVIGDSCSGAL